MLYFQVDIDFEKEPIGVGKDGKEVYFRDIWPSTEEIAQVYSVFRVVALSFFSRVVEIVSTLILEKFLSTYFVAIIVIKMMPNRLSNPVCCQTCSRGPIRLSRKATQCGTSLLSQKRRSIHGTQNPLTFMTHHTLRT